MSTDGIKHFLVIRDVSKGHTEVRDFGDDYDAAQAAYARVEWETLENRSVEAVLLSSDSLETVKRTHSSWFGRQESFESLLPPGVLRGA
jgi:hypothetical protein